METQQEQHWRDIADQVHWQQTEGGLKPFYYDNRGNLCEAVWAPQPGSQEIFLDSADSVFEVLYEGTRGPGKTDALLMDFCQDVGRGWGEEWKGVLFRKTYPDLKDVIDKSKKWIPRIWPRAVFNEAKNFWTWPDGEQLLFRQFEKPNDYWKYHGHAYPWQGWEELTTWANDECYKSMFSCARSTRKGIPIRIRATTNPYGPGHNWVKQRFRLPLKGTDLRGKVITDSRDENGDLEPPRCAVHGHITENLILLSVDPGYIARIKAAARNKAEAAAWLDGSWDIVAGGMLDDVWDKQVHIVPNLPAHAIPRGWRVDRSYDHGSSAPFSVGWWAESNGEPVVVNGHQFGTVRGDVYRIAEWYGFSGKPNEGVKMLAGDIGKGILDREDDLGLKGRVKVGPADTSIFDDYEPGSSVAGDMEKAGVKWSRADKGPGSRKQGWEQIRKMLKAAKPKAGVGREEPGLFICERCTQFIRTVPVLPRCNKDPDDVDTTAEDHIGDEVRYRLRHKPKIATGGSMR